MSDGTVYINAKGIAITIGETQQKPEGAEDGSAPVQPVLTAESLAARQRGGTEEEEEARAASGRMWLTSFADLFSLMLCFFVMLYSVKDPDLTKINEIIGFTGGGVHQGTGKAQSGGAEENVSIERVAYGEALNLDYLEGVLKNSLAQAKIEDDVSITAGFDHLKLKIDGDQLFSDGAVLSTTGTKLVKDLAARLMLLSNRITVVGLPEDSGEWGGSLAQAKAFAGALREGGYRKPFMVLGLAEGRGPAIEVRVSGDDGRLQ